MLTPTLIVVSSATAVPGGPAHARALRIAAQPAANAEVARAERKGRAALRRLAARIERRSARAPEVTGPSPERQALAVALWNAGASYSDPQSGDSPFGPPSFAADNAQAHAAGCWGKIHSTWWHSIAGGAIVARMQDWGGGWCGNRRQITYGSHNFYPYFWTQYPYCFSGKEFRQGWDGTSGVWAHSGTWSTTGVYTGAFVCLPILGSQHRNLRIAANGYWDRFDDYGF